MRLGCRNRLQLFFAPIVAFFFSACSSILNLFDFLSNFFSKRISAFFSFSFYFYFILKAAFSTRYLVAIWWQGRKLWPQCHWNGRHYNFLMSLSERWFSFSCFFSSSFYLTLSTASISAFGVYIRFIWTFWDWLCDKHWLQHSQYSSKMDSIDSGQVNFKSLSRFIWYFFFSFLFSPLVRNMSHSMHFQWVA